VTTREVVIRNVEPMDMLSVDHTGPYPHISQAFEKLFGWLGQHHLLAAKVRMIAIFYDDPSVVAQEALRSKACALLPQRVEAAVTVSPPVAVAHVQGGEYVVLLHKGSYSGLPAAYAWLYGTWFPQSGREAAKAPGFEEYLNSPMEVAPDELLTEIFVPLV
jgi:AraC family transcriptional regulator